MTEIEQEILRYCRKNMIEGFGKPCMRENAAGEKLIIDAMRWDLGPPIRGATWEEVKSKLTLREPRKG
jgi:hypothetical protein